MTTAATIGLVWAGLIVLALWIVSRLGRRPDRDAEPPTPPPAPPIPRFDPTDPANIWDNEGRN